MKLFKVLSMTLEVALLLGCNPNRPKYESVLEEMDKVVSGINDEEDDGQVRIVNKDKGLIILNEILYQQNFEPAPVPKDLWEYLWLPDKSIKFNNYDGTFICEINKDLISPMTHTLCIYEKDGGHYPAETVKELLTELQGQYARSLAYSWTVSLPMTILFNRFTQQALRLCPDISLLTEQYTNDKDFAIIELPRRYADCATNVIVFRDKGGKYQTMFSDNLHINRIEVMTVDCRTYYMLYTDNTDPDKFQLYVFCKDEEDNIDYPLQYVDHSDVLNRWLTTGMDMNDAYFRRCGSSALDLVYGPKESRTVRTLHLICDADGNLALEFDPDKDEHIGQPAFN